MNTKPIEISDGEWDEIMKVPEVIEGWGLDGSLSSEDFKRCVYGVKFDFTSGGPGYCGDVFILLGDGLELPMTLYRDSKENGELTMVI